MHFILLLLGFEHFVTINEKLICAVASKPKQLIFKERLANVANFLYHPFFNGISIKSDSVPYFVKVALFLGHTVERIMIHSTNEES